jgi:hypothetical protein
MHKHTYEAHKDKIKVENVITALFKDFKIRKQKVLQKIEYAYRSVLLDDQGHSPWQLYAYERLRYRIQYLETQSSH